LNYSVLPAVNATLNSLSFVLLVSGFVLIRRRNIRLHKACMLAALSTSALFLVSYVAYHIHVGHVRFGGLGAVRTVYLTILGTHSILAAAIVPLALVTVTRALRGRFSRHRAIARWTLPIWLYVSVTGVVVYLMLYHLYPPRLAVLGAP
jgi:putative membrane protein